MWFSSRSHDRQPSSSREHRRARGSSRRRAAFRPALAALESRQVLSTLTVRNTNDSGPWSLRAEIAAAHSGDTIRFDGGLAGESVTLTGGELVIDKSLDIEGPGAGLITVDGDNAGRVFHVEGAATVRPAPPSSWSTTRSPATRRTGSAGASGTTPARPSPSAARPSRATGPSGR